MRRIAFLVVAFIALAGAAAQTPRSVVQQFYTTYLRERPPGLPDGRHLEAIAPYLSGRLRQQIDTALRQREAFIRESPDEKPPFVDDVVYSGAGAFNPAGRLSETLNTR
jgi:hypothetical protein